MSKQVLIELHFLPSLEYFCALYDFNEIIIERHERFVKQSYRNRCYVQTTQRVEMLSVPLTGKHHQALFRDIRVDQSRKWFAGHWRTIMSAYRNSPYFEHYSDELQSLMSAGHKFIYDLDMDLLSFCLKSLRWKKKISETSGFNDSPGQTSDLRSVIADRQNSATRELYKPLPYYQVFGQGFAENLSLIDLLFCKGPDATDILVASRGNQLNK